MTLAIQNAASQTGTSVSEKPFTIDMQSLEIITFECVASDEDEARILAEMVYPDGSVTDVRVGHDSKRCLFCGQHCGDECDEAQAGGFNDDSLSIEQLQKKYGYWGEHPECGLELWRDAICKDETRASYWHWVWMRVTANTVAGEGM